MVRPLLSVHALLLSVALLLLQASHSPFLVIAWAQNTRPAKAEERERGIALYREGKNAEAVEALKKAVKKNKADYEAWHFLGLALMQKQDLKNAIKSFEAAIKVQPRFAAGHTAMSYALLLRGKSEAAMDEAEIALNIEPGLPDAQYIMGVIFMRSGAREEALSRAEAALKLNSEFAPAYLLKSQALVRFAGDVLVSPAKEATETRTSRYREAAAALERFLELNPNTEDRQTWIDHLESLRFYAVPRVSSSGDNRYYSSIEVTTKVRILFKPEPAYTESARANGVTGTVILRALFASDGTLKHFLVVQGLPYDLTEQSIRAARRIKFSPATIGGRPVSMLLQLEYNFNLY